MWAAGTLAPVLTCLNAIVFLILAVVGGIAVINGHLSLGAAQVVVVFASQLAASVKELAGFLPRIQSGAVSAAQVRELLLTPTESGPAVDTRQLPPMPDSPPLIDFDRVSFGYEPGTPVLHDVTFSMPPGTTTAIVGTTGSGKTTLTSLLQCFYSPGSGQVRIDGTDVAVLGRAGVRAMLAAVAALSPVSMTETTPRRCRSATASRELSLMVSATAKIASNCCAVANMVTVRPCVSCA